MLNSFSICDDNSCTSKFEPPRLKKHSVARSVPSPTGRGSNFHGILVPRANFFAENWSPRQGFRLEPRPTFWAPPTVFSLLLQINSPLLSDYLPRSFSDSDEFVSS